MTAPAIGSNTMLSHLLLLALFTGLLATPTHAAPIAPWEIDALRGQAGPNFSLPDSSRKPVSLVDYRGKVILLNFWATWCPPCRHEMPALARLQHRLPADDFSVLAISVDETATALDLFLKKLPLPFPVLHDQQKLAAGRYKIFTYPTSLLLDREGKVVEIFLGEHQWDSDRMVAKIKALIQQPTPSGTN